MNIIYIKKILDKYKEKDFSNLLNIREKKIKTFSFPLSVIVTIIFSYLINFIFNIQKIIEEQGFFNVYFLVFLGISFFILYQSYFIIQGIKAYFFDKKLEEDYQDLFEIYKKVLFIKYQEKIRNDNPFPYFLTDLNKIKDEEIKEYIGIINKVKQINKTA